MKIKDIKNESGFTIVELLAVIVIIGILAALVIISYTGIQNRARNQQTISAVRQYITAFKNYEVDNGGFPNVTSCLGSGYTGTRCMVDDDPQVVEDRGGLNSVILKPYLSKIPTVSSNTMLYRDAALAGAAYSLTQNYIFPNVPMINFVQFGTTTCPNIGGLTFYSSWISDNGADIYCHMKLN